MGIVSSAEIFDGRTGSWTCESGRSYVRTFLVQTDYAFDGPNVAISAIGIARGDAYTPNLNGSEYDQNSYANKITATQQGEDPLWWIVTVEYGPYSPNFAGGGPTQNPLLMPIDVSWSLRDQEVVADRDINGAAIVNTAGDPFNPPLVEDDPRAMLTVVRNEQPFDIGFMLAYRRAVNSDTFAGFPPLFSRVVNIAPKSLFHQDVGWYYQVTYEFEFIVPTDSNENGYRRAVLSQGTRALSVVTNKPFHITLHGIPITEPMLLSDHGTTLNIGDPPFYCIFQTRNELEFAAFNFDDDALTGARAGFTTGYGDQGS